jgi:hypothetical protein
MPQSFENLIEKYGVPFLVIPNQPRLLSFNDWGWVEGQERKGAERGDILDFGNGFTLPLTRVLPQ